jgi:hypothetical protein
MQLDAFDAHAIGGDDLRSRPRHLRQKNLANLAQLTRAQGDFHCVVLSPQDRKIGHDRFRAACNGNPEWSDPRVAPHAFWSPTIGITTPPNVLSAREGRHLFSEKMCAINDLFISALLKLRTQ